MSTRKCFGLTQLQGTEQWWTGQKSICNSVSHIGPILSESEGLQWQAKNT